MRHRRSFFSTLIAGSLSLFGCGGDSGSSAAPQVGGGVGHWTADQLCSLTDEAAVGALFPGVKIRERAGIDDADWSACVWKDADGGPLDLSLFTVSNRDHDGGEFSDSFEPLNLLGAEQSVYVEDFAGVSAVLVAIGGQLLDISFELGTAGGRGLAVAIAEAWIATQS